jgi:UDP-perosamine 4-acetyltransferase
MEKIIIAGCGGHARSMVDSIESAGQFQIAGFVDASFHDGDIYRGYHIIGTDNDSEQIYKGGIHYACIGVGFVRPGPVRDRLYSGLKNIGYILPAIIDPTAVTASDISLGDAVYIGKKAVVNSAASVSSLAIINTGAIVEHNCIIGKGTHIAVGAVVCGETIIGKNCLIGSGATIIQCLNITDNVIIGAGSVVINNIEEPGTYVGIHARKVCNSQ